VLAALIIVVGAQRLARGVVRLGVVAERVDLGLDRVTLHLQLTCVVAALEHGLDRLKLGALGLHDVARVACRLYLLAEGCGAVAQGLQTAQLALNRRDLVAVRLQRLADGLHACLVAPVCVAPLSPLLVQFGQQRRLLFLAQGLAAGGAHRLRALHGVDPRLDRLHLVVQRAVRRLEVGHFLVERVDRCIQLVPASFLRLQPPDLGLYVAEVRLVRVDLGSGPLGAGDAIAVDLGLRLQLGTGGLDAGRHLAQAVLARAQRLQLLAERLVGVARGLQLRVALLDGLAVLDHGAQVADLLQIARVFRLDLVQVALALADAVLRLRLPRHRGGHLILCPGDLGIVRLGLLAQFGGLGDLGLGDLELAL